MTFQENIVPTYNVQWNHVTDDSYYVFDLKIELSFLIMKNNPLKLMYISNYKYTLHKRFKTCNGN